MDRYIGSAIMIHRNPWHVIVACCVIMSVYVHARDVQETVLQAHKHFEQGDIDKALELYDSIEKKGTATWYNKGMCHYKKRDYVQALVCWKKAERNASWLELADIHYNLDRAYNALNISPESGMWHYCYRYVIRLLSLLTLYGWQLLFLLMWTLLLLLAARLARRKNYGILSLLSVLVMLFATALYMKYDIGNTQQAIVLEKNLLVYAGPDKAFHELGSLERAHQITVCENQEKWLKVRANGMVGWVCDESVALV